MYDFFDSLGDANIFISLDCNSEYWKIPVAEMGRDKPEFISHQGRYRFKRMNFRLKRNSNRQFI